VAVSLDGEDVGVVDHEFDARRSGRDGGRGHLEVLQLIGDKYSCRSKKETGRAVGV
jgi:hypothetical protein